MEERANQPEEPILARARKARVLRIQDQVDRCPEPLIGECCCLVCRVLYCILLCQFSYEVGWATGRSSGDHLS